MSTSDEQAAQVALAAWQQAFGTSQLTHALAERDAVRKRLGEAREKLAAARDALAELRDVQNGPPLPKYEQAWTEAIAKADAVLFDDASVAAALSPATTPGGE